MKPAVGYIRVSTEGQATEGISLEAQTAKVRAWCEVSDCTLAGVFVDAGLSGGRADNRPELQKASPSTTYYFRVEANNASGSSAWSNTASATTLAAPKGGGGISVGIGVGPTFSN